MKRRHYQFTIDGDIIPYAWIYTDDNGVGIDDGARKVQNMMESSTSIINISLLAYQPEIGDVWDGTNFSSYESRSAVDDYTAGRVHFAFLDASNTLLGDWAYNPSTQEGTMMIAIFSSNPIISVWQIDNGA